MSEIALKSKLSELLGQRLSNNLPVQDKLLVAALADSTIEAAQQVLPVNKKKSAD